MKKVSAFITVSLATVALSSCTTFSSGHITTQEHRGAKVSANYESRLPSRSPTGGKVILVDPKVHAWGAYGSNGELLRAGLASAGANWCPDLGRPCHTKPGVFHINSLGSPGCKSSIFPMPRGGAPMPYCMFFDRNQALHGAPEGEVVEGNVSHGCVRLHVWDAEWIRYNFATVGTEVIVRPY